MRPILDVRYEITMTNSVATYIGQRTRAHMYWRRSYAKPAPRD